MTSLRQLCLVALVLVGWGPATSAWGQTSPDDEDAHPPVTDEAVTPAPEPPASPPPPPVPATEATEAPPPPPVPATEAPRSWRGRDTSQIGGPRIMLSDARGELSPGGVGAFAVAPDGTRHSLRTESTSERVGKQTIMHSEFLYRVEGGTAQSRRQVIGRWSSNQKYPTAWTGHAGRIGQDGRFYALAIRQSGSEKSYRRALMLLVDGEPTQILHDNPSLSIGEAHLLLDANNRPIVFFRSALSYQIERLSGRSQTAPIFDGADYDWSVARDATGWVYVSAYDYDQRALVVFAAREGVWKWQRIEADGRESGWQHSIAAYGDEVFILTYYLRNTFNRGLNVVVLRGGELVDKHTHFRAGGANGGWSPLLGIGRTGRVLISHRQNEQEGTASIESFGTIADFLARRVEDTGDWDDEYKSWSVAVAGTPRYRNWRVVASYPSEKDAPLRFDAKYEYDPAIELGGSAEVRLGDWNLGLIYLQNIASQRLEDAAGKAAATGFRMFAGWVGIDQLLFGHDLKLSSSFGDYRGTYRDDNGVRVSKTPVTELEVRLLNQWRIGYGLAYRDYGLTLPYYVYVAPEQEAQYFLFGAGVAEAKVKRYELFAGYSRVDYLTRYENDFNGIDVDIRAGLGLSLVSWPKVVMGSKEIDGTAALATSAALKLGYVVYHRFHSLQGAGFVVRAGYEASWMASGFDNDAPSEREEDDDDEEDELEDENTVILAAHHQYFHGPYVSLGLVY